MSALDRIEAILAEIERLDRESRGQFREASDRECFDVAARIERKMVQSQAGKQKHAASQS